MNPFNSEAYAGIDRFEESIQTISFVKLMYALKNVAFALSLAFNHAKFLIKRLHIVVKLTIHTSFWQQVLRWRRSLKTLWVLLRQLNLALESGAQAK